MKHLLSIGHGLLIAAIGSILIWTLVFGVAFVVFLLTRK